MNYSQTLLGLTASRGKVSFLKRKLRQSFFIFFLSNNIYATTLHVGNGYPYTSLIQATDIVQPGDTVMVHSGTYSGGVYIENLQGNSSLWIYIFNAPGDTVIYNGGANGWQLTDAAYLHIKGIIFQQQTANGFNLDDGGSYDTPSHNILFDGCTFWNINATGNNDLLKMSGVDEFEIRNCLFMNGALGGSGIDMVGCHNGLITENNFENLGSNSIQAKGGSKNVVIERNFFIDGGLRALNLGGSTGLTFFRPIDATYEAADLKVYSNVFIGSEAPIAFVGCINTEVINNTIYMPSKWVIRILQETVDTSRFEPCGSNTFRNNIVYHDNQVTTDCNIGPNTDPVSFIFSNNLWYHSQNDLWTGPVLPVPDADQIVGENPLFVDETLNDFNLKFDSPAIGNGYAVDKPAVDYNENNFNTPRSIGAFEGNNIIGIAYPNTFDNKDFMIYPNPASGKIAVSLWSSNVSIEICNQLGEIIVSNTKVRKHTTTEIDISNFPKGIYFVKYYLGNEIFCKEIIFQ